MKKDDLEECLRREVNRWSTKPYEVLVAELRDVVAYNGERGEYQVEVQLLETEAEYVHVSVAVDDGGLRAFVPLSTSFLAYRDGHVDKPQPYIRRGFIARMILVSTALAVGIYVEATIIWWFIMAAGACGVLIAVALRRRRS